MKYHVNYFSSIYTLSFASIGVFFPLIAQYLAEIGFTGLQIGIVTASSTAIGILANPFWGGVYHRNHNNKKLILFLCVATALLALTLLVVRSFLWFLLLYIIIFFFENPIFPLIDSTTLEANYPFGVARKWGAIGFALGIGVGGLIADRFGLIWIIPTLSLFLFISAFQLMALIHQRRWFPSEQTANHPQETKAKKRENSRRGYVSLLRDRSYVGLLISIFFYMGPSMAHNTYFSFLFIDVGGTVAGMGLALLLMVISEAPFMAWAARLSARFTTERLILSAMILSAIRYLWFGTGPGPEWLMATFVLQGFANGILLVEVVKYISKVVDQELVSLAIPLYTAISANTSTIVCQLLGGILVGTVGGQGVYLFYGGFTIIGIVIYIAFGLHRPNSQKRNLEKKRKRC